VGKDGTLTKEGERKKVRDRMTSHRQKEFPLRRPLSEKRPSVSTSEARGRRIRKIRKRVNTRLIEKKNY